MSIEDRKQPEKTFDVEMANLIGIAYANLLTMVERNPDLPLPVRTGLIRTAWKLAPVTDAAAIRAMRAAYEPWLYYSPAPSEGPSDGPSPDGMPS